MFLLLGQAGLTGLSQLRGLVGRLRRACPRVGYLEYWGKKTKWTFKLTSKGLLSSR
jgi:hypothetical protein